GFLIERSTNGTTFTQIDSVGAGITTYTDTGRTTGVLYYYRVRATNAVGNSAYSNTASATGPAAPVAPTVPSNLIATAAGSTQINLTWTDNSSNETGFLLERKTGSGAFVQIATLAAGVTLYSDTGLTPNTQYTYRVRATNSAGNSSYSNTSSATTTALGAGP